ncbi:MAG: PEP-CTERM sorting domain-containing protein, partial [Phycisphaerales bacterium]|nr:PEP-CTERM sorting domain-containing protein [Phycisphaerales bacterium]
ATWSGLDAGEYAAMLAGNISGDIYFNADTDNDIADGAVFIGTWNVIPAPGSMALLGLGGIVAGRRRR